MKWAVSFPEESILLVRPCLVALCHGNRPAAKLLSVLIYRYSLRLEHKSDAENINEVKAANGETADQDTTFRIYRKQSQLVTDMCDEITEKTLHDVAVPTLQLFGYLDVDESPAIHCYDLHMDVVVAALEAYKLGTQQLEKFLIAQLQLEKFLINKKNFQLNKKNFQLALEKILIANRNFSNNKRGRKPRREAAGEAQSEKPQINLDCLDDSEIDNGEGITSSGDDAPTPAELLEDVIETHDDVKEELKRITGEHPAVHVDNESHYHIANGSAIGNEERVIAPALSLPSKGVSHARRVVRADLPSGSDRGDSPGLRGSLPDRPVEQTPGTPESLPLAAVADYGRHGDTGSVQAISAPSSLGPEPAQATIPPAAGSVAGDATTAQAKGFTPPKRPRAKRPPVMPAEPPTITLTPQEQFFWLELWCKMFFNKDIAPELTPTAYRHVRKLAPHITSAEQMESLTKKARQDLEDNTGVKRKTVYLGNCVNSYPGWKQEQAAQAPPEEKPMDKYTAASRNEERNERGLQRLRDMITANGGELPK